MGREILDLYSDYLLYSNGQAAAIGLSKILEEEISRDKTTRFLPSECFNEKTLWKKVKKPIRAFEGKNACLIFDDTVIKKPYTDGNEIICRHFDAKEGKAVKGINLLSTFYSCGKAGQNVRMPIGCRIIAKAEEYSDLN
jgi:hypothetical protein